LLLHTLLVACAAVPVAEPAPASSLVRLQPAAADGCNGDRDLCHRRYDAVAYATTHNAMSSQTAGFLAPNQRLGLRRQLDDGVRALMLDSHYLFARGGRTPMLCHKLCWAGQATLAAGLREVAAFLQAHPREVVTIILESRVSAEDTRAAFVAAGLGDRLHVQKHGARWPTLGEMIAADRRLVVFTDRDGGAWPGYHAQWHHTFENPHAAWDDRSFACKVNRGRGDNALFVLNHFVSNPLPDRAQSARVNQRASLLGHLQRCARERGRWPNFVTVDHYDLGDVLAVVDEVNGLAANRVAQVASPLAADVVP